MLFTPALQEQKLKQSPLMSENHHTMTQTGPRCSSTVGHRDRCQSQNKARCPPPPQCQTKEGMEDSTAPPSTGVRSSLWKMSVTVSAGWQIL